MIENEITVHKNLDHYNIIKYIDSFIVDDAFYCIVMEYASCKNLRNMMKIASAIKKGSLKEELSMNIFA